MPEFMCSKLLLLTVICILFNADGIEGQKSRPTNVDWCSPKYSCSGNPDGNVTSNVMCKYPTKVPGLQCRHLQMTMTFLKRFRFLELHNRVRKKFTNGTVAGFPKAANMRLLRWDFELEALAYHWAIQCINNTDVCRNTPRHPSVGQNMVTRIIRKFVQWNRDWNKFPTVRSKLRLLSAEGQLKVDAEVTEPMDEWVYDQLRLARPENIKPFKYEKNTQGLFQVIWAETSRVGCTEVTYLNYQDWVTIAWVCNYAPSGNVLGSPSVYEPGPPCSRCPPKAECICGSNIQDIRSHSPSQHARKRELILLFELLYFIFL